MCQRRRQQLMCFQAERSDGRIGFPPVRRRSMLARCGEIAAQCLLFEPALRQLRRQIDFDSQGPNGRSTSAEFVSQNCRQLGSERAASQGISQRAVTGDMPLHKRRGATGIRGDLIAPIPQYSFDCRPIECLWNRQLWRIPANDIASERCELNLAVFIHGNQSATVRTRMADIASLGRARVMGDTV